MNAKEADNLQRGAAVMANISYGQFCRVLSVENRRGIRFIRLRYKRADGTFAECTRRHPSVELPGFDSLAWAHRKKRFFELDADRKASK